MIKSRYFACLLILSFFAATALKAIDANEIVKLSVEKNKLFVFDSLKAWVATGKMINKSGELEIKYSRKLPNCVRMDITNGKEKAVQLFDGSRAWLIQGDSAVAFPNKMISEMMQLATFIEGPLKNFEKKGYALYLKEERKYKGQDCFVLDMSTKQDQNIDVYVDKKNYRIIHSEAVVASGNVSQKIEMNFGTFKKAGAATVPHEIQTIIGEKSNTVKFDKIVLNPKINDKQFEKP